MDKYTYSDDEDDAVDRLSLNVGGVKFETYMTTLQNISDTRLAWLTENVDPEIIHTKEFFFDRHPGAFVHILNYYRTGKLHTPTDMCGPAFEEELQFWGIDEKQMEPCCWETFTKHREAEENLRSFEGPGFEDLRATNNRKISTFSNRFVSREYLNIDLEKIWQILEDPHSSQIARRFSILSCLMIVISVSLYCVGTMPALKDNRVIQVINYICLVFFTMEFLARIIITPSRKSFLKDYKNWIDFASLLPSYLVLIFPIAVIKNMVIIRTLRLFKFFKLSYGLQVLIHTLKASSYELTLLLFILLIPVVIFSSLVHATENAFDKGTTKFDSIPTTFWWCIITMTTVGYGDLTPETWAGQMIGSVCSIFGLLIVALPISVIGSNFTLYYAHVKARLKLPKKNRTLLQGNLRGLLRQPLSLSSRDRDRKTLRRNNNNAIRRKNEVVSPSSFQLQLKRRKAFDQISGNTSDGTPGTETPSSKYISSDLITNANANQARGTGRSGGRRAAMFAIELSENGSVTSEGDTDTGLLRNSYADEAFMADTPTHKDTMQNKTSELNSEEVLVDLECYSSCDDSNDDVFDVKGETKHTEENVVNHEQEEKADSTNCSEIPQRLVNNGNISTDKRENSEMENKHKRKSCEEESASKDLCDNNHVPNNRRNKLSRLKNNTSKTNCPTPRTQRRGALALQPAISSSEESDGENIEAINSVVNFNLPSTKQLNLNNTFNSDAYMRVASDSDLTDTKRRISMKMMTSFDHKLLSNADRNHHRPLKRAKTTNCQEHQKEKPFYNISNIMKEACDSRRENGIASGRRHKNSDDASCTTGSSSSVSRIDDGSECSISTGNMLEPVNRQENSYDNRVKSENDIVNFKILSRHDALKESGV